MLLVRLFVCFVHVSFLSFFPSSLCRGLAAVCDCGTHWTFLLTYLENSVRSDYFEKENQNNLCVRCNKYFTTTIYSGQRLIVTLHPAC